MLAIFQRQFHLAARAVRFKHRVDHLRRAAGFVNAAQWLTIFLDALIRSVTAATLPLCKPPFFKLSGLPMPFDETSTHCAPLRPETRTSQAENAHPEVS